VARYTWKWTVRKAGLVVAGFLTVDLAFLFATLPKFLDGGYIPIGIGAVVVAVMYVWHFGQNLLHSHVGTQLLNWADIHGGIADGTIVRTPGTGVFLASNPDDVPQSLSSHVQLLHSLPAQVRVVTIVTQSVPVVVEPDRFFIASHGNDIDQVVIRSGFMETPHVPLLMDILAIRNDKDYFDGRKLESLPVLPDDAIYFTSNRTFVASNKGHMPALMERLFSVLHRNAASPTAYFNLPTERVVTLGTLVDL
jgi:KUP system potassium uptake protein